MLQLSLVMHTIPVPVMLIFHTSQGILQLHFQFKKVSSFACCSDGLLFDLSMISSDESSADILQKVMVLPFRGGISSDGYGPAA